MYHSIGSIKKNEGLRSLHVPAWLFHTHMLILRLLGYKGLSINELLPYLSGEKEGKVVGITFDDGFENVYKNALPILSKFKFSSCCFLVSGNIGGSNFWDIEKGYLPQKMMSKTQVSTWINSGMEVGSHTVNHKKLTEIKSDNELIDEIIKSKTDLEKQFNCEVNNFCYPYGAFNSEISKVVENASYKSAVTVRRGIANSKSDLFSLPRIFITHRTYPLIFLFKLLTSYEEKRRKS